ncbi:SH3 domain-containing protein [Salinisphaera sp. SPP-AMP-43]|uniref:SH3 domain-containing protein n=1 Tax=Salinisphaera sp. SPP-AMP-43 TaxID=3121288 RepID=UPI003C6E478F
MRARPRARLFFLLVLGSIAAPGAAFGQRAEPPQVPSAQKAQQVLRENRPLAENGDASAQYNMGVLYDQGYGVEQDYAQARQWYEKAAAQHYGRAEHNLGIMYEAGKGMARDPSKAAHWFRRGADDGQAASQNNLAVLYMKGEGVPQNTGKAAFWTARAAAAGNSAAIENLPRITRGLPHIHVNADDVNVRDQPNREARVVRHLDSDTIAVVLARRDDWSQILLPNSYTTGWVANFLLSETQAPLAAEGASAPDASESAAAQTTETGSDDTPSQAPSTAARSAAEPVASQAEQAEARQPTDQPRDTRPETQTQPAEPSTPKVVRSRVPPPAAPERTTAPTESVPAPSAATSSQDIEQDLVTNPATSERAPAAAPAPADAAEQSNASKPEAGDLSMIAGSTDDEESQPQASSEETAKTARVGVAAANVRARAAGGANVVGQLYRGDEVQLLGERNGWRRIRTENGLRGWIAGYLLVIP